MSTDVETDNQDEPRPWEQPGAVRRDVEPHRAELLGRLANVSVVCGAMAPALVVTALPGVALGHAAYWLAEHDLRAMAEGRKDPTGRGETERARRRAQVGIALSLFSVTGCGLFWLLAFNLLQWLARL